MVYNSGWYVFNEMSQRIFHFQLNTSKSIKESLRKKISECVVVITMTKWKPLERLSSRGAFIFSSYHSFVITKLQLQ